MGKKGITSDFFTTPGGILLIMLIAAMALLFTTGGQGGIYEMIEEVCVKYASINLPFCDRVEATTQDYEISASSTSALACAMNKVLAGLSDDSECELDFRPPSSTTPFQATGNAVANNIERVTGMQVLAGSDIRRVTINRPIYDIRSLREVDEMCEYGCEQQACDNLGIPCEVIYSEADGSKCHCTLRVPNTPTLDCYQAGTQYDCGVLEGGQFSVFASVKNDEETQNEATVKAHSDCEDLLKDINPEYEEKATVVYDTPVRKCDIYNFYLPQRIEDNDNIGKIIEGFGDPDFLVYYEVFPVGQDTWNDFSKWYQDIGQVMFFAMCAGHVLRPFIGVTKTAVGLYMRPARTIANGGGNAASAWRWLMSRPSAISASLSKASGAVKGTVNYFQRRGTLKALAKANMDSGVVSAYRNVDDYLADAVTYGGVTRNSPTYRRLENTFRQLDGQVPATSDVINYLSHDKILISYLGKPTQESIARILLREIGPTAMDTAIKTSQYMGIDLITYYILRTNSEFGKFVDEYPGSIVLQNTMNEDSLRTSSLKDPELGLRNNVVPKSGFIIDPVAQNVVELGMPVLLDNPPLSGAGGIKHLLLASPCRANLEVYEMDDPVVCGYYSYEKGEDGKFMTMCLQPESDSFISNLLSHPSLTGNCGALTVPRDNDIEHIFMNGDKTFVEKEYEIIETGLKNVDVFRGLETISTDRSCCLISGGGTSMYRFIDRDICADPETRWNEEIFGRDAEATLLHLSTPTPCSGVSTPDTTNSPQVITVIDPLNGIELYYDTSTGNIEYYRDGGDLLPVNEVHINPVTDDYAGNCIPIEESDEFDYLTYEEGTVCFLRLPPRTSDSGSGVITYTIKGNETDEGFIFYSLSVMHSATDAGFSSSEQQQVEVIFEDTNMNGITDRLRHSSAETETSTMGPYRPERHTHNGESIFSDYDEDGTIDSFIFDGTFSELVGTMTDAPRYDERMVGACEIDAIGVKPRMVDIEGEYNYCQQMSYDSVIGFVATTGFFAMSAVTKVAKSTIWATVAAVAVDCGLAFLQHKLKRSWPGHEER